MTGLFLEFGLLLLCSIFQCSEGLGKDECPEPDTTKFAECHMDQYVVGTLARYDCNKGYRRNAGVSNIIQCKKVSKVAEWRYSRQPNCTEKEETVKSSIGPQISTCKPKALEGMSPIEKRENITIGPQISTITPTAEEGFCGVPVPLEHATVIVTKYKVGQKLTVKYWNESQACGPVTGIIMCDNSSGVAIWSSLNPQCTDDVRLTSGKQCLNPAILFIMAAGMMVFIL